MGQKGSRYENYKRIAVLGEGSFGKALLVKAVNKNSLHVLKEIDLTKKSKEEKEEALAEVKILESLNHPNIVHFREVYKTKSGKLCIVMDYADGGDLWGKLNEQKGKLFPEDQILDWFTQICLAIKHCHDRKIIHRDLKLRNIFLTRNGTVKLGDFGVAKVLSNTWDFAKTWAGTPYYFSPELINGASYSFKSDIWSLGVVLYELCTHKPPFNGTNIDELTVRINKAKYNPISQKYSKELQNLIAALLTRDPYPRPTINDVLEMSIIQPRVQKLLSESVRVNEFSHTILHNQQCVNEDIKFENIKVVLKEEPIPEQDLNKQDVVKRKQSKRSNTSAQSFQKKRPQVKPYRSGNHLRDPLPKRVNKFEQLISNAYKRANTSYPREQVQPEPSIVRFQNPPVSELVVKNPLEDNLRVQSPSPPREEGPVQCRHEIPFKRANTSDLNNEYVLSPKDEKKLEVLVRYPPHLTRDEIKSMLMPVNENEKKRKFEEQKRKELEREMFKNQLLMFRAK